MNEKMVEMIQTQINKEFESGYFYLDLALQMEEQNYNGYSVWLTKQYKEEFDHAEQMIAYLQKRNVQPKLTNIEMNTVVCDTPLKVAKEVLGHEEVVTKSICMLCDQAKADNDYMTLNFLQHFIDEQLEEEDSAREVVDKFTMANGQVSANMIVDGILGGRQ